MLLPLLLFSALAMAGSGNDVTHAQDDDGELVVNGGFEELDESGVNPAGWFPTILPGTAEFISFRLDDQVSHSGQRSALIEISPRHPLQVIHYNWAQIVSDFKRKKYRIVGYVKTENIFRTPAIAVQCWNADFTEVVGFGTTEFNHNITGTTDWKKIKAKFKIPPGTFTLIIRALSVAPDNNGGKIWFDDISITRK
jgi:hypothetical protein